MVGDIHYLQQRLVDDISRSVQDQTILDAFKRVPRHEFIEQFFDWKQDIRKWELVSLHDPRDQEWLEQIYTNRLLVTSVNQYNRPDVSSSQPDIMAKMIQSVKVQRGTRVLEIGTGTGYNAAILATLVGNENVVSIDINAELLKPAQERIERTVGPGVTLLHVDGRYLQASEEFDAILLTACHDRIEPSWVRALTRGARLILNWSKSFSKVFLEAEKVDRGLVGRVAEFCGDFMSLHDGFGVKEEFLPHHTLSRLASLDFRTQLVEDFNFGFFLQVNIPSLTLHRYRGVSSGKISYSVKDDANRVVHFSSASITGDASLWNEIQTLYEKFKELNSPRRKKYSLNVDEEGIMTFCHDGHVIGVVNPFVSS